MIDLLRHEAVQTGQCSCQVALENESYLTCSSSLRRGMNRLADPTQSVRLPMVNISRCEHH